MLNIEFWQQVLKEIQDLDDNWTLLCASDTFRLCWKTQNDRKQLQKLGQQFLDEKSSTHPKFFCIQGEDILLFRTLLHKDRYWREKAQLIRLEFIQWNIVRIQSLTTVD